MSASANAKTLRRAAELLRQRAKEVTPGPWMAQIDDDLGEMSVHAGSAIGNPESYRSTDLVHEAEYGDYDQDSEDEHRVLANAGWIATAHPGLAEPLAKWLDHAAMLLPCDWCASVGWACRNEKCCPDCAHGRQALAVARVLLGET